jgi:threonine/homoserine/homoserine lactone efflux protein
MLSYFIAGSAFGLSAGFAPGPLLALVMSQTVQYGLKEGVKTSMAPMITDLPIIAAAIALLSSIYAIKPLLGMVSIVGSLFLAYLAYENMKINKMVESVRESTPNSMMKGALVNALNPHPYLFWFTVGGPMIVAAYAQNVMNSVAFFVSFYVCLVGAKVVLAFTVNKYQGFFSGRSYIYLMKLLGVALFFFSCVLFRDGLALLFN